MTGSKTTSVRPHILQVSTSDTGGGAERVALDLHAEYRARELDASLALGMVTAGCAGCVEIPNDAYRSTLTRAIVGRLPEPSSGAALRVRQLGRAVAEPVRALRHLRGRDDFDYPATAHLAELVTPSPDVLHLHNVHGGYFDLGALPELSARTPTVVTLHDTWLLSGHCAYSLDCDQWLGGCGSCPYPANPPAMHRDASAANWRAKRDIMRRSRLHVVGPSRWILDEATRSILAPAMVSTTLIRNGVDQTVFRPGDRKAARASLGLPSDALVIMFAANSLTNAYKDFPTLLAALPRVAERTARPVILLALGGKEPLPGLDERSVRLVPYTTDRTLLAEHLHAADVFVHATRADNYPLTTLEAQSCGVPVVVTDVGGAAETVVPGVTGCTYPPGDTEALSRVLGELLGDDERRARMGDAALGHAAVHHSASRMADEYLGLYGRILAGDAG